MQGDKPSSNPVSSVNASYIGNTGSALYDFSQLVSVSIQVTKEDIDGGAPGESCDCAITRAVNRATGMFARVSYHFILLFGSEKDAAMQRGAIAHFRTPETARVFINQFDKFWSSGSAIRGLNPIRFVAHFTPGDVVLGVGAGVGQLGGSFPCA